MTHSFYVLFFIFCFMDCPKTPSNPHLFAVAILIMNPYISIAGSCSFSPTLVFGIFPQKLSHTAL